MVEDLPARAAVPTLAAAPVRLAAAAHHVGHGRGLVERVPVALLLLRVPLLPQAAVVGGGEVALLGHALAQPQVHAAVGHVGGRSSRRGEEEVAPEGGVGGGG